MSQRATSPEADFTGPNGWRRSIRSRHPRLLDAVVADARVFSAHRGERFEFRSRGDALVRALRLFFVTDAFFALVCCRVKARCQTFGVPVIPGIAHRLAMGTAQVSIGDPVVIEAGIYLPHGQVVIDGLTTIGTGTTIAPFVTIGLVAGELQGPTIDHHVSIGTGAKILGPVQVGAHAKIGANAVVLRDVPTRATAVGVPARVVQSQPGGG
jgi:serine O-acetyltransferase